MLDQKTVSLLHAARIIVLGNQTDPVCAAKQILIYKAVRGGPAGGLTSAGNGQNQLYPGILLPHFQGRFRGQGVKSQRAAGKEAGFSLQNILFQRLGQDFAKTGPFLGRKAAVTGKAETGFPRNGQVQMGIVGQESIFSTAMNASLGICTVPNWRIRFFPSFCFSKSFFFLVISPP